MKRWQKVVSFATNPFFRIIFLIGLGAGVGDKSFKEGLKVALTIWGYLYGLPLMVFLLLVFIWTPWKWDKEKEEKEKK